MATRAERAAQRRTFWQGHFDACAASGLSIKRYTAEHGLSAQSYYAAHKRYVHDQSATSPGRVHVHRAGGFARVVGTACAPAPTPGSVCCRFQLAGGTRVELEGQGAHFEAALRALVSLA